MSQHELEGKKKKAEGDIHSTMGKATGNESERIKGYAERAEGKIEEEAGKAKRKISERT